eukprot:405279_1
MVSPAPPPDRCSWVTLVMRGDRYVPGALVMAHSMKQVKTAHTIVCMVTPDVSDEARERLGIVFDEVIIVEYLSATCKPLRTGRQRTKYESWISDSFTKWQCLSLTQFDKVILVDADKMILSNIDELFLLPAPAGTFSSPWGAPFIMHTKRERTSGSGLFNPYTDLFGSDKYGSESAQPEYCDLIKHGGQVRREAVKRGLDHAEEEVNSFVCFGTMVLLAPSDWLYAALKTKLAAHQTEREAYGHHNCNSGYDEQMIAELIINVKNPAGKRLSWRFIHQKYNFIPWHKGWLDGDVPRVFHFFGKEPLPWLEKRNGWPDLELFWQMATHLLIKSDYSESQRKTLRACFSEENLSAPAADFCTWCKDCKEEKRVFSSHTTFDDNGELICPRLQPENEQNLKKQTPASKRQRPDESANFKVKSFADIMAEKCREKPANNGVSSDNSSSQTEKRRERSRSPIGERRENGSIPHANQSNPQNQEIHLEQVAYRDLMLVGLLVGLVPTILILPVRVIRKDFRHHPDLRLIRIENDQEAQFGNAERMVLLIVPLEIFQIVQNQIIAATNRPGLLTPR